MTESFEILLQPFLVPSGIPTGTKKVSPLIIVYPVHLHPLGGKIAYNL